MVECPLCDAALDVEQDELDEGDVLVCEECGANLVVTNLDPLEIEEAEEEEEELDDTFDDDDEDDPWSRKRRKY